MKISDITFSEDAKKDILELYGKTVDDVEIEYQKQNTGECITEKHCRPAKS